MERSKANQGYAIKGENLVLGSLRPTPTQEVWNPPEKKIDVKWRLLRQI